MSALTTTAAVVALLAAGYALGRLQPYDRLANWVNWELRFHPDRWDSRPRQAVLFALLLITDPINTIHAWRHRKDPPPPQAPAPKIRRIGRDAEEV